MRHLTTETEPGGVSADQGALLPKGMRDAVVRYRWWIVVTALAVTTLVTLWTVRLPKVYQATVTLEYDPNPTSPLGSSIEDIGGQASHFLMSREFFETQNLIIQSRAVAERVVERLGLADDPSFFGQEDDADWAPVPKEVAAQRLQSKLSLDPIKDTRLVRVALVLTGVGVATWRSRNAVGDATPDAVSLLFCAAAAVVSVAAGALALWIGARHFNRVEV